MSEDLSKKTCCLYDNGLFIELAARLSRDFGRVLYFTPWKSAFPKLAEVAVGEGVPGVERVYDIWPLINEIDLFIFPDVYDGDLQVYLRLMGKRVWGSAAAEFLELDRWRTKELQKEIGVQGPPGELIKGLDALREFVNDTEDKWIKTSMFRGDFETYHHQKPFITQQFLNKIALQYGPQAESVEFIIEDGVEGQEIGFDGYTIDGQFPSPILWGVEVKDRGYVGQVVDYDQLPQPIQDVNEKFAPVLKEYEARSFVSFEMRVNGDGEPVVIDPCMRCGNPPTEVWMELYDNLAEIFWYGAVGELVSPVPVAQWAAMVIIHSQEAAKHWTPIAIPKDIRQWVKLRCLSVIDGIDYYVPNRAEMVEIGAVIAVADTLEEAVELVHNRAEQVDGFSLDIRADVLDAASETLAEVEAGLHSPSPT